ncbi:hypothetical protein At1D1460_39810 [Agrobacterium tumefaciens]|uniref:Uncharacterized protein n=1 Tax=Agrobacterium tumefaciens str. B6 TaxID=1183423 RepID=A0A822V9F1_AGRTU|nr:hypothetical protein At1D1460_39810 [Agrobacterium tumefaciens]CVI23506.1 hypothetical protein AGR4A_Lc50008 [Agrobacterium tumefaciens str. B6]SPZ47419.1 Uncharacterised protein [Agrobacterium tumefaciens]
MHRQATSIWLTDQRNQRYTRTVDSQDGCVGKACGIGKSKGYDETLTNASITVAGSVSLTSGRDTTGELVRIFASPPRALIPMSSYQH